MTIFPINAQCLIVSVSDCTYNLNIWTHAQTISYGQFHSLLKKDYQANTGALWWANKHRPWVVAIVSSIIILTLFFWQVSQRDHALHSDKTQSTGWTNTWSPTDRASRAPGFSSLAAVTATLLWHVDENQSKWTVTDIFTTLDPKVFMFLKSILLWTTDRTSGRAESG